jgi:lycopene beta-cyclase
MHFDYLFVGGGLQNGVAALALRHLRPEVRIGLCERGPRLGGNHTWSFHLADVPEALRPAIEPLIVAQWPGYDVHFPGLDRHLAEPYATVSSERFDQVVREVFAPSGSELFLDTVATKVSSREVVFEDGRRLSADVVVDARGPSRVNLPRRAGFQKFVGLEVRLTGAGPWTQPVLMDATVPQQDGYRFVYVLPFTADRILVEDTYYSDTPHLEVPRLRDGILAWIRNRGLEVAEVLREEQGVLPLPLEASPTQEVADGPVLGGYQGGWFHPTTGYSAPLAFRLAEHLATVPPEEVRGERFKALERRTVRGARFGRLLNQLLFLGFAPGDRWRSLERFYRLPEATIRRFYGLQLTSGDRLQILCGRPPRGFSVATALRSLRATRSTPSSIAEVS